MVDAPHPPAGWYPDPQGSPKVRYWDGAAWTAHFADAPLPPPLPGARVVVGEVTGNSAAGLVAGAGFVLVTDVWAFVDWGWIERRHGRELMAPGWVYFFGCWLFWFLCFPLYLTHRHQQRTLRPIAAHARAPSM